MVKPKNIKKLQKDSQHLLIKKINKDNYAVQSTSDPLTHHVVTVKFDPDKTIHARCTCRWSRFDGVACSHVMATLNYLAALKKRELSFWLTKEQAEKQRKKVFYLKGENPDDDIWITSGVPRSTPAVGAVGSVNTTNNENDGNGSDDDIDSPSDDDENNTQNHASI